LDCEMHNEGSSNTAARHSNNTILFAIG